MVRCRVKLDVCYNRGGGEGSEERVVGGPSAFGDLPVLFSLFSASGYVYDTVFWFVVWLPRKRYLGTGRGEGRGERHTGAAGSR